MSKKEEDFQYLMEHGCKPPEQVKPRKRHSHEEHSLQVRCVNRFRYEHYDIGHLLISIPNGVNCTKREKSKLKAEGLTVGASDLILLVPRGAYGYLCLECKTHSHGSRQSEEQREWQRLVEANGGCYKIFRDTDEFFGITDRYLILKDNETF